MRCFLAIELPEEVRRRLDELSRRLQASRIRASWVKPENMHITLKFLGELDSEQVASLVRLMPDGCRERAPFVLRARGAGVFPNLRAPKVVWAGIEPYDDPLVALWRLAEEAGLTVCVGPERQRFRPHVTLARVKDAAGASRLSQCLVTEKDFDGGQFTVSGVTLFSSTLTPKGAVYERVEEFRF